MAHHSDTLEGVSKLRLLPAAYARSSAVSALYLVPSSVAYDELAGTKLHPIVLPGRRSVVVVTLFDFGSTPIGPYKELSVGVLAVPDRSIGIGPLSALKLLSMTGAWILALPVSSELACQAGVTLFGYPKTVNCINVQSKNGSCLISVDEGLRPIVSFEFQLRGGPRVPVPRLVTYSQRGKELLETTITTRWFPRLCTGRGARMELKFPEHKLAKAIARLELPSEPRFVLHGERFEAILTAGKPI